MTRHMSESARREQILEAARLCFVESGYLATRMDDVARKADLSKGGIYFYFPSKHALLEALVEEENVRSMAFLELVRGQEGAVAGKLELLGRFYPLYFAEHPEAARFFVVLSEAALREPAMRDRLRTMQQVYLDTVGAVLQEGVDSGELKPFNTQAIAVLLKAMLDGLEGSMALGLISDLEAVMSTGMQMLLHGLLSDVSRVHPPRAPTQQEDRLNGEAVQ